MISLLLQASNLLTPKVEYGLHRVRCRENQTSTKKLLAKNMQSNGHSIQTQVFCRVHWALNSVSKSYCNWLVHECGDSVSNIPMSILQSEEYHKNLTQKLQGLLLSTLFYFTFLFLLSYDQHLYQQLKDLPHSVFLSLILKVFPNKLSSAD